MLKKLISLLFLVPCIALASEFIEGKDYKLVTSAVQTDTKNKTPVVTEFFSYGCPWCYKIDPFVTEWVEKMKGHIQFEQVPVVFKPDWELYAKAYYTAKTLAMASKLSPQLFKSIQEEKRPLTSKRAMIDFFVAHGVDKEIATSAFENSSTIDMRVQNGMTLMAGYQINAIPAFVVKNKYKTDLQMAGSKERLFEILAYLVNK